MRLSSALRGVAVTVVSVLRLKQQKRAGEWPVGIGVKLLFSVKIYVLGSIAENMRRS